MCKLSISASALVLSVAVAIPHVQAESAKKDEKKADITLQNDRIATESSEAKGPGLEISGGTSFNAYLFKQKQREVDKGRGHHFASDNSRINFEVLGKAGPRLDGLEYSFLIGLTGNTEEGNTSVEENRIKLKHRYGTVMLGVHRGVTDFMSVGAFIFHAGTGNVLGNYKSVVTATTGVIIKNDPIGHAKDKTKATYVSPRMGGIQLGYSFASDGDHSGEKKLATAAVQKDGVVVASGQSLHELGANFKREFVNGFGLQLSATALLGGAKNTERFIAQGHKDIQSYALGFVMSYAGFSFGGEYLNNGKSLEWKGLKDNDAGRLYSLGLGYEQGRHTVSLGYLYTKRELGKNRATNFDYGKTTAKVGALSYNYKLAKGLKVYAEGVAFNYNTSSKDQASAWMERTTNADPDSATGNNKGHAIMLGTAISF